MPQYDWIIAKTPSFSDPFGPLVNVGKLWQAKSRQFQLVYNRAGTASFQLRTNDPMVPVIMDNIDLGDVRGTIRHCLRIRRDGQDIWSGKIRGIQVDLGQGTITYNCSGWLEEAVKRILWTTYDASGNNFFGVDSSNNPIPSPGGLGAGMGTPADIIAFNLIRYVNGQDTAHPLLIQPGTAIGDFTLYPRNRYYLWGQTQLWPALQELSDIEAGYNIWVDPVTRAVNLSTWNQYDILPGVQLGYRMGPNNLSDVAWQEDGTATCNYMGVISLGAPVFVNDPTSMDQYGLFEEYNTISNANQNLLQPYGVAELVIRSRPLVTYTITPSPSLQNTGPRLFEDYQIGDQIYWSAQQDHISINSQAIRVFGATIQLDDNDNEQITALQTTVSSTS